MTPAEIILCMREVANFSSHYEGADGIDHYAQDSFRVWRSLPEQIRSDIMGIIFDSTVRSGDKHVRNGGNAIRTFMEFIDMAVNDTWGNRPTMPGDADAKERRAMADDLEKRLAVARSELDEMESELKAIQ